MVATSRTIELVAVGRRVSKESGQGGCGRGTGSIEWEQFAWVGWIPSIAVPVVSGGVCPADVGGGAVGGNPGLQFGSLGSHCGPPDGGGAVGGNPGLQFGSLGSHSPGEEAGLH